MNVFFFRIILVAGILLSVLSGVLDFIFADEYLRLIKDYAENLDGGYLDVRSNLFFVFLSGLTIISLISYIGLFLFWSPSRYLYLVIFLISVPFIPLLGVHISSGANKLIIDMANIISGFIIAIVFFSPLKERFR